MSSQPGMQTYRKVARLCWHSWRPLLQSSIGMCPDSRFGRFTPGPNPLQRPFTVCQVKTSLSACEGHTRAKSSGLVQKVRGENRRPSNCCFLLLEGHAGDGGPCFDSLEVSARLMRGQRTPRASSPAVLSDIGMYPKPLHRSKHKVSGRTRQNF